ncbi:sulfur carrier protein ThiS [Pantoea sp. 1.19]|uniref:sulfur carrier protein ThiS n=1 Tax=Pantoea sp. 1.19 TaxID=1925589 RepID=UPI000948C27C|nr:sulfur carrier protein ThiS [Pantoea sp. 1.19]
MHITVNDAPQALAPGQTLLQLLTALAQPLTGTALAVNGAIVPRERWQHYSLQAGDDVVLFRVIAGG